MVRAARFTTALVLLIGSLSIMNAKAGVPINYPSAGAGAACLVALYLNYKVYKSWYAKEYDTEEKRKSSPSGYKVFLRYFFGVHGGKLGITFKTASVLGFLVAAKLASSAV